MRKIGFGAGYYEWVVMVNDKLYYSFEDLGDWFGGTDGETPITTRDELICLVDNLVFNMEDFITNNEEDYIEQFNIKEKIEQLTDEETEYLKNMMLEKLENFYLD